jgi:APA family basic amino acid/polyamine antiporter
MTDVPENPNDPIDLKRSLSLFQLTGLGIGCVIGAGIFVMTGQAAAIYAGPGVVISFAIAAFGCLLAGLCYSEFASMIPIAGSAYTYTYATLGPFMAWIIGWNLVLEYLATASTVAVGWSGYFNDLMLHLGLPIPAIFNGAPLATHGLGSSPPFS